MKATFFALAAAAGSAAAQNQAYARCGGQGFDGDTTCPSGYTCHKYNDYYSQCIEGSGSSNGTQPAAGTGTGAATSSSCKTTQTITRSGAASATGLGLSNKVVTGSTSGQAAAYAQCGGSGFSGSSSCASGYECVESNEWYSQCLPSSGNAAGTGAAAVGTGGATEAVGSSSSAPTSAAVQSSAPVAASSSAAPTTSSVTAVSSSAAPATSAAASSSAVAVSSTVDASSAAASSGSSSGGVSYAGVNIAGLDFGCYTDGTCNVGGVTDPGQEGIDQMKHFATNDGLNTFRLPVGWQFLVNDNLGGTLDSTNFGTYDALMQGCLDNAEMCIIDIHNYARWNGQIVGQGGPTNAEFSSLWSQLATKYADNDKVVFAVMNEPHGVDIDTWAETVQAAVTAIRKAGATSQKILLPGNEWTHGSALIDNGSAKALKAVTNIDGSTDNLIFDVHQYLDSDGSGTHTTCTDDHASDYQALGDWLRDNKRQAILTETGGGADDDTCLEKLCSLFDVLNNYSDVYLGWTGWAAGAFASGYELAETPTGSAGSYTDVPLVSKCVAGKFS